MEESFLNSPSNMISLVLVSIVAVLCAISVALIKKRYNYWKDRGIPYIESKFLKGCLDGVGRDFHMGELIQKYYFQYKNEKLPFIGAFFITQPAVIITDLELAKNIMIKDFQNFPDRATYYNESDDPLSAHMFNMDGPKWKAKRAKLTPTFTTGKLRQMAPLMLNVAKNLESVILKLVEETGGARDIELKEYLARFTTDVIGSCVFGFECNCLAGLNTDFRRYAKNIFETPRQSPLQKLLLSIYPKLGRAFGIKVTNDDTAKFFTTIVKEAVEYREKNNFQRNDFLNLLIELKNGKSSDLPPLSMDEVSAESFLFFAAGFETSSSTIGFCLFELALNPDIQDKARANVLEILQKNNGDFSYETIKEMTYIDQVLNETLRKYPILPILVRRTINDYPVKGTNFKIESGVFINIPAFGFQNDPEIWPEPEKFDPSRFDKENAEHRHPSAFIPFGIGPRNCIGMRFGKLQAQSGLAVLLRSFKFSICQKTNVSLKFETSSITLSPQGGIWLRVEKI